MSNWFKRLIERVRAKFRPEPRVLHVRVSQDTTGTANVMDGTEYTTVTGALSSSVPEESKEITGNFPVTDIKGVGPATAEALEEAGVKTISQLARMPVEKTGSLSKRRVETLVRKAQNYTEKG